MHGTGKNEIKIDMNIVLIKEVGATWLAGLSLQQSNIKNGFFKVGTTDAIQGQVPASSKERVYPFVDINSN